MIEHTYRAAVKIGDDYVTVEQKLILPVDASDDAIATATATAARIFAAQCESVELQIGFIREQRGPTSPAPAPASGNGGTSYAPREPDAPASTKQHEFIDRLRGKLGWSVGQLETFARGKAIDLLALTKGQASALIDALNASPPPAPPAMDGARRLPGMDGDDIPPPEPNGGDGEIPF